MSGGERSFAGVSHDEAVSRAHALVPALRERAKRGEEERAMLHEIQDDLHRSGLLRIVQPKRWGGMELDFVSLVDIPAELARGCASTAWNVGNFAIHQLLLALYDDRTQKEVWGENPDALIAAGIAYPQGQARAVDGGFVIGGHWNFSSGVDPADWIQLAVTVRDGDRVTGHRMCMVRRGEFEIVDDWFVLGMRATGSKSVRAKDLFVPEHRALDMTTCRGSGDAPGSRGNPNPLYRVPYAALGSHGLVGAAIGNARAALELTCEHVKSRSTNYTGARMRDFQTVQQRVGAAGARIEAAQLMARNDCVLAQHYATAGRMMNLEEKLRVKRNLAYAVTLCTEAVDLLHTVAGAIGIYDGYPIQRLFRDAHALAGHFSSAFDAHGSSWGLVAMGGEFTSPTL